MFDLHLATHGQGWHLGIQLGRHDHREEGEHGEHEASLFPVFSASEEESR